MVAVLTDGNTLLRVIYVLCVYLPSCDIILENARCCSCRNTVNIGCCYKDYMVDGG